MIDFMEQASILLDEAKEESLAPFSSYLDTAAKRAAAFAAFKSKLHAGCTETGRQAAKLRITNGEQLMWSSIGILLDGTDDNALYSMLMAGVKTRTFVMPEKEAMLCMMQERYHSAKEEVLAEFATRIDSEVSRRRAALQFRHLLMAWYMGTVSEYAETLEEKDMVRSVLNEAYSAWEHPDFDYPSLRKELFPEER